ncbi:glycoside hydrolase family 2 TIM barrel-domain containing protein [Bacteroides sp. GM023]|uniref:glycoside hydrolase family 2 TIM barrel-domain containing protein n=1 Tax=Bacteroides sp. GM023 TaxID=2723058 RepID=UPI001CC27DD0|nr:glycoside hydrolase family 2 TIM barrel-domain containing protein [Bacteroides sp. GM023]
MMKKVFLIFVLGIISLTIHAVEMLKEWEDNQVTGINREDSRASFWYYSTKETAINGGYYNCPDNISLNGKWKFSFATNPDERKIDFYKPSFDVSGWDEIQVPSSWPLQGYDKAIYLNHPYEFALKNPYPPRVRHDWNPVGSFRRVFTVPQEWKDRRVVLHFGAVKSAFYVWINGQKVGYSQDSKMQAEFDITPYLHEGENVLAVEVYRFSIGSYLECQDFWRLAGIKRDVWLYATPKAYIKDFWAKASLKNEYKDGKLDVEVKMATNLRADKQQVNVQLMNENGDVVYSAAESVKIAKGKETKICFSATLPGVKAWTAETPYLYTLLISSGDSDQQLNYVSSKVGFRTVELKNAQLMVNGRPIYVRGVNRHEHHPKYGHYVPRETVEKDIELMKKLNINAIRTCHYPADPYLYELCDRYGLYICDEANIESHGLGAALQAPYDLKKHIADDPSWEKIHHDRIFRMFKRDKNHPSVIIWSLGNECGDGIIFQNGYHKLKGTDSTRLVQFEQAGTQAHTDIYCPMYMRMDKIRNYALSTDVYRPLILCEYAHAMGNSLGNFQDYWDLFEKYPMLQGGFIWDWVDQGMEDFRDGTRFLDYGGAFGLQNERNDKAFCLNGLINADRELNPHAHEAKKVMQGLRVKAIPGMKNEFELVNNLSFTDASHYRQCWRLEENGVKIEEGELKLRLTPLGSMRFQVPFQTRMDVDKEYFIIFEFKTLRMEGMLPKDYCVAYDQLQIQESGMFDYQPSSLSGSLIVNETEEKIMIGNENFSSVFDKRSGALSGLILNGFTYLDTPVRPDFWRVKTDNDGWFKDGKYWKNAHQRCSLDTFYVSYEKQKEDKREIVKSVKLSFKMLVNVDPEDQTPDLSEVWFNTNYTIYPNATIKVENEFLPVYYHAEREMSVPRIGQLFKLNGELEMAAWYGRGPWENYADRKTSALVGRYRMPVKELAYSYVRPQENGYRTDVRELILSSTGGNRMKVTGLPLICFNAQYAPKENYEINGKSIRNTIDLKQEKDVFLNIDFGQMGVGGDNSWGNPVHVDYRILLRDYRYGYVIQLFKE